MLNIGQLGCRWCAVKCNPYRALILPNVSTSSALTPLCRTYKSLPLCIYTIRPLCSHASDLALSTVSEVRDTHESLFLAPPGQYISAVRSMFESISTALLFFIFVALPSFALQYYQVTLFCARCFMANSLSAQ